MKFGFVSILYMSMWPFVNGYFGYTHRFLGKSLAENLNNINNTASKKFLEGYVSIDELGKISTWADTIKRKPEFRWTQTLHYIDLEACTQLVSYNRSELAGIIVGSCQNNCIYTAILNMTNDLKFNREFITREQTITNIKLLLHFLQDLFQPMHTFGGHHTRGGNGWKIRVVFPNGKVKTTNMHTLWDSLLPEYYIKHFDPVVIANPQKLRFVDIYQYQDYLKETILMVLSVACRATNTVNTTIVFKEYFDPEIFKNLFQHYIDFVANTLVFIAETKN